MSGWCSGAQVYSEQGGGLLDAAVTALDWPAEGLGDASVFRPAHQTNSAYAAEE